MKRRLRSIVPYLFIGLAGAAATYVVIKNRQDLGEVLASLGPLAVVASFLFGILGTCASFLLWRQMAAKALTLALSLAVGLILGTALLPFSSTCYSSSWTYSWQPWLCWMRLLRRESVSA